MPDDVEARVAALEKQIAKERSELKKAVADKDKVVAKLRKELHARNESIDAAVAEVAALRKVAGMSEAERQAVAAELAKVGD